MNTLEMLNQVCADLGIAPLPPSPPPVSYTPVPGIDCYCCDFRRLPVEGGTVKAVLTDIPYYVDWLPTATVLADWCANVLVPDGVLVTWLPQYHLDESIAAFTKHLHFQWCFISPLVGSYRSLGNRINSRYQLACVFSVGATWRLHRGCDDWVPAGRRDKKYHKHGKTVAQMQYLVEAFSQESDLICDPCSGGWTTAEACYLTNRHFIGGDIDPECLGMARQRFSVLNI